MDCLSGTVPAGHLHADPWEALECSPLHESRWICYLVRWLTLFQRWGPPTKFNHIALDPWFMPSSSRADTVVSNVKAFVFFHCASIFLACSLTILLCSNTSFHMFVHTHLATFKVHMVLLWLTELGTMMASLSHLVDNFLSCSHMDWSCRVRPKLSNHLAAESLSCLTPTSWAQSVLKFVNCLYKPF